MKSYHDQASKYFEIESSIEDETFIKQNIEIVLQINEILQTKGWTQSDLATEMGKSNAEVSKWLSGIHNLTLKSLAKLKVALNAEIIITPRRAKHKYNSIKYVTMKIQATSNNKNLKQLYPEGIKSGNIYKTAI